MSISLLDKIGDISTVLEDSENLIKPYWEN